MTPEMTPEEAVALHEQWVREGRWCCTSHVAEVLQVLAAAVAARQAARARPKMTGPNHTARLTEEQVMAIWRRAAAGESVPSLMRAFDAGKTTIRGIVNGKAWTYLTGGAARPPLTGRAAGQQPILTERQVIDARRAVRHNGEPFTAIAARLGVTPNTVAQAVRGITWGSVDAIEPPYTEEIGKGAPGRARPR